MLQKKQFKIFKIINMTIIQTRTIKNDFKQLIELTNGNLVSISLCENNQTDIVFWEKNLINGKYEIDKIKRRNEVISIIEINKYKCLILSPDSEIIIVDSYTGKEIEK